MYNLKQALLDGYEVCGAALQRGYVTRKPRKMEDIEVFKAGGKRKGKLYFLDCNYNSTNYCFRIYLSKGK